MGDPKKMSETGIKRTASHWLYILILLCVMHVLLDGRYRIVSLFPTRVIGFGVLGSAYLVIVFLMIFPLRSLGRLLAPLDDWIQMRLSPFLLGQNRRNVVLLIGVLVLMIVTGCWLRWCYIQSIPIAPRYADMLPLIQDACEIFVKGQNPYGHQYFMPWTLPLTYWPGMWLPYVIPHMLSVDIRWVHIVAIIAISLIISRFLFGGVVPVSRSGATLRVAAFATLFLFLFSTEPIFFATIAHTPPLWLWVTMLAAAILLKRPWMAAVCLGIVMASRQPAVVYGPLMAIYWLRSSGSIRTALKLSLLACGTWFVICGPFLVLDPYAFLVAPIRHYAELGKYDFARGSAGFGADTIGLSYLIQSTHVKWLLPTMAALAVSAPWLIAWKRLHSATDVLLYLGGAGVIVTLAAPIPFHYEYFPSFIFLGFASIAAATENNENQTEKTLVPNPRLRNWKSS